MLKTQISKDQIEMIGEEIRLYFDPFILEQGLELQQKGYVYNAAVEGTTYNAKVQDMSTYDVALDLEFLVSSTCSCPYDGYCRHMAAAFFYAYSNYGRPDAFVKRLKAPIETDKQVLNHSSLHRITSMIVATPPSHVRIPTENDPVKNWFDYMNTQYELLNTAHWHKRTFLDEYFTALNHNFNNPIAWWSVTRRKLFTLCSLVFTMRISDQLFANEETPSIKSDSFHKANKFCMDRFVQTVKEINWSESLSQDHIYIEEMARLIREQLFQTPRALTDWLYIYRLIWSKVYTDEQWVKAEIDCLEQELESDSLTGRNYDLHLLARVHIDILHHQDELAALRLQQLYDIHLDDFLIYLHTFSHQQQWDRLLFWLRWLQPSLQTADQAQFNLLCSYWSEAVKQQPSDEEWIDLLASMLPRSYDKYTNYLLQSNRFKEWVDLHVAYGVSLADIPTSEIKTVEQQHPSMLLPLFHQAIERNIQHKTRDSYKSAAKLLKKLQSLYEGMGETLRFQTYMRQLTNQFARLRAFQEELRKGRLL